MFAEGNEERAGQDLCASYPDGRGTEQCSIASKADLCLHACMKGVSPNQACRNNPV